MCKKATANAGFLVNQKVYTVFALSSSALSDVNMFQVLSGEVPNG